MDELTGLDDIDAGIEAVDYGLLPDQQRRRMLPRALRSVGGTLTQAAQTPPSALPAAVEAYRRRAAGLYQQGTELMDQDVDTSALQAFARQQGRQGDTAMLNAMAAQYAGESFQPVQAQFLKRATAAREPIKLAQGMLTPDGQFIRDPFASQDKRVDMLLQQAKAYEQMALTAQTAQERADAQRAQQEIQNMMRTLQLQISQQNADTGRMMAGAGPLGTGNAVQIGSGANSEPVMRSPSGALFTYDSNGQPTPYSGNVNPKVSSSSPSEDERKAASWFAQADNARQNMADIIKRNPGAAFPGVGERVAGFIPGVGQDIANLLRPEDRQMFVQAANSMAEALLRAATGAGVTEAEAKQKVAELVPQIGDKQGTVKQKMDSYPVYMNALRARAGRALSQQPGGGGGAPAGGNRPPGGMNVPDPADPLGLRRPR
jgi:hypothetical protein